MSSRKASESVTHPKMVIPGKPGPQRVHHCRAHGNVMTPVKVWGKSGTSFTCKEGCRLNRDQTDLR